MLHRSKIISLRSIVYHLFRNHGVVLTPDRGLSLRLVSLPESFLRPDLALGSRPVVNVNRGAVPLP